MFFKACSMSATLRSSGLRKFVLDLCCPRKLCLGRLSFAGIFCCGCFKTRTDRLYVFQISNFFRASFGFLGLVDTVRGCKARLRSVSLICLKRNLIHFDFLCKIH